MKRNILVGLAIAAAVGLAIGIIKYSGRGCSSPSCLAPAAPSAD